MIVPEKEYVEKELVIDTLAVTCVVSKKED